MGLFSAVSGWFRAEDGGPPPSPADDFWYEEAAQKSSAGIRITPDIALKATAVYACVKILAETVATMPLRMRRDIQGGSEDAPNHPLDEIIRYQPNDRHTAIEFWETMMLHAVLRGAAYAEIIPGRRGAVDQLIPLTGEMRIDELRDRSLRFHYIDPTTKVERVLLQEEVFRIPGMSSDGITGMRAVDLAAEAIGLGMAADQYASRVFSNRLNIGGYLVHPKQLSPEGQKNLVHALMMRFAGPQNSHRPIVLQEGMEFKPASMNASEAQLTDARKWQTMQIAMFWHIPLHMLGIYEGVTHANVEQQAIDFVKYTIRPWVKRIEQAIRRDLITAKGVYFAEFNLEGLLRGDSAARAAYFKAASGSGGHRPWMTVNEIRRIEGLNPVEGGDKIEPPVNKQTPPAGQSDDDDDDEAQARAEKLVRRENTAVRKAAMRFADDPDAFRNWVKAFYGGHVSSVTEILEIPKSAAQVYCAYQRDELLKANDVVGLIDRRDQSLAGEIAKTLKANKDQQNAA